MKAEIITLHYIQHYGSLLQTYATCKVFEKIGIEAEVIDYVRPNADEDAEIKAGLSARGYNNPVKRFLFILSKKIENKRRKNSVKNF